MAASRRRRPRHAIIQHMILRTWLGLYPEQFWSILAASLRARSIGVCDGGGGLKDRVVSILVPTYQSLRDNAWKRTHGDPIYIWLISCIVVFIQCFLRDSKSCADGWFKFEVKRISSEGLINVVHSRDDSCKTGRRAREEECRIFEYLEVTSTENNGYVIK